MLGSSFQMDKELGDVQRALHDLSLAFTIRAFFHLGGHCINLKAVAVHCLFPCVKFWAHFLGQKRTPQGAELSAGQSLGPGPTIQNTLPLGPFINNIAIIFTKAIVAPLIKAMEAQEGVLHRLPKS